MSPKHSSMKTLQRGQSLVEMSIGFVVMLLILMGILDLGRVYFLYVALQDGAGEAALYLSINSSCPEDPNPDSVGDPCDAPKNAFYRALTSGGDNVNWGMAEFDYDIPDQVGTGVSVSVTIRYPYQAVTPVIQAITRNLPIILTVSATHTVLRES